MKKIQLRFIMYGFVMFCLALCTAPLPEALAGQSITINGDVSDAVHGNGPGPNGTLPNGDFLLLHDPNDNELIINGGTVGGGVFGATDNSVSATVTGNSVIINGGQVGGSVYGGEVFIFPSSPATATVTGNSVTISGGTVGGNVYGGAAYSNSGSATATNNTVTISGNPTFGPTSYLYGGDNDSGTGDAFTGNTLNLHSPISVYSVQNFEYLNFYLPSTLAAGEAMITIGSGGEAIINSSTVNVGIEGGRSPLAVNDELKLIDASAGTLTGTPVNSTANGQGMQGVTLGYEFEIQYGSNALIAKVTRIERNERAKALSEGFLAGLVLVSQGADLIAGPGLSQAMLAAEESGFGAFGAMAFGQSRYDTGSYVDVSSLALLTGFSRGLSTTPGRLTLGAFFEYGNGNYDTYNSFANAAAVHGDGQADRFGGGILGRMDFNETGSGHAYLEASGRLGQANNDYRSADLRDLTGRQASFDSSSAYYGLHLGAGYLWNVSEQTSLDLYAKYFWSAQEGDSVTLSTGDRVEFEDADSSRLRLGGRLSFNRPEAITPYIGLAWEHEFDGEVRGTSGGYSMDPATLRGATGIGEIGLSFRPAPERLLSLDLGLSGYVGQRQGFMGNLAVKWEF